MATIDETADHIFISSRRFHELLAQGVIDKQGRGEYELDVVREQYIEHLRSVAAGRGSADGAFDLTEERARLAKEQADAQEMKNAVARGELLPKLDVHVAVVEAFSRVRAKLLSLPSKVAPVIFGLGSIAEVREKVTDGISEALAELSGTRIAGVPASEFDQSGGDGGRAGLVDGADAAAEPKRKPVGRSRAPA
jgi:hypothetical protein